MRSKPLPRERFLRTIGGRSIAREVTKPAHHLGPWRYRTTAGLSLPPLEPFLMTPPGQCIITVTLARIQGCGVQKYSKSPGVSNV